MIGTYFNYHDLSQIPEIPEISVPSSSPVVLACFGADKGTEGITQLSGNDFVNMYGSPNFKKYGQTSLQARRIIDAGGTILGCRVVADDATLANAIIVAKIYRTKEQKKDSEGNLIYIDADTGEETTTEDGNTPAMVSTAHVRYEAVAATDAKDLADIKSKMGTLLSPHDDEGHDDEVGEDYVSSYPLFVVYDNGRGVSNKRFHLYREDKVSKNLSYMYHSLFVTEDGAETDHILYTMVPDTIVNDKAIDLESVARELTMVGAYANADNITAFIERLSVYSEIDVDDLTENDFMFGTERKGTAYPSIKIDTENGVDLTDTAGIPLSEGTNGSFGDSPMLESSAKTAYLKKIKDFFDGTITDDIFDVDSYQIAFTFDANFPKDIKESICALEEYRKDFMFFRDFGTEGIVTVQDVEAMRDSLTRTCRVTDYCQSYDVIDTYSKKQINVTIMYDIAPMMVANAINSAETNPFAGKRNGAVITSIIPGTLNYKPKVTPAVNEKDTLEDIKVNFGTYFKDTFVLETLYTSQEDYTQLSFSNNEIAVQKVVRALRTHFPSVRYAFVSDAEDLEAYTKTINDKLLLYANDFEELSFRYVGDSVYLANKIYKAVLEYRFKDFIQAEIIDAYALPSVTQ